jgi:hypothetical protein
MALFVNKFWRVFFAFGLKECYDVTYIKVKIVCVLYYNSICILFTFNINLIKFIKTMSFWIR